MSTKHPEALAQECADYATSLRSAINVVMLEGRKPPISFLRAAELFERAAARIAALEAIDEPAQPVAVARIRAMSFPSSPEHSILGVFLSAMSDQLKIDGPAMRDAMLWYCNVQEIATAPQPAAQAAPNLPAQANIGTAPQFLNLNDKAMWVLGWNACLDAAHAAQKAAA